MAYVAPDADTFQLRFPVFASVDDAAITPILALAARKTDSTWIADDRAEAEMLYAAHILTLDGFGDTREAALTGFVTVTGGSLKQDRSQKGEPAGAFGSTTYGQRFKELMKLNVPGIVAC